MGNRGPCVIIFLLVIFVITGIYSQGVDSWGSNSDVGFQRNDKTVDTAGRSSGPVTFPEARDPPPETGIQSPPAEEGAEEDYYYDEVEGQQPSQENRNKDYTTSDYLDEYPAEGDPGQVTEFSPPSSDQPPRDFKSLETEVALSHENNREVNPEPKDAGESVASPLTNSEVVNMSSKNPDNSLEPTEPPPPSSTANSDLLSAVLGDGEESDNPSSPSSEHDVLYYDDYEDTNNTNHQHLDEKLPLNHEHDDHHVSETGITVPVAVEKQPEVVPSSNSHSSASEGGEVSYVGAEEEHSYTRDFGRDEVVDVKEPSFPVENHEDVFTTTTTIATSTTISTPATTTTSQTPVEDLHLESLPQEEKVLGGETIDSSNIDMSPEDRKVLEEPEMTENETVPPAQLDESIEVKSDEAQVGRSAADIPSGLVKLIEDPVIGNHGNSHIHDQTFVETTTNAAGEVPVEDPVQVDPVEVPVQVDAVEVPLNSPVEPVEVAEESPVDPVEVPVHVDPVEVPLHVDPVEVPLQVDPVEVPLQVDPVEVPLQVDPVEVPLQVNPVEVPLQVDPVEVPLQVDPVEVPLQVDPVKVPVAVPVQDEPADVPIEDKSHPEDSQPVEEHVDEPAEVPRTEVDPIPSEPFTEKHFTPSTTHSYTESIVEEAVIVATKPPVIPLDHPIERPVTSTIPPTTTTTEATTVSTTTTKVTPEVLATEPMVEEREPESNLGLESPHVLKPIATPPEFREVAKPSASTQKVIPTVIRASAEEPEPPTLTTVLVPLGTGLTRGKNLARLFDQIFEKQQQESRAAKATTTTTENPPPEPKETKPIVEGPTISNDTTGDLEMNTTEASPSTPTATESLFPSNRRFPSLSRKPFLAARPTPRSRPALKIAIRKTSDILKSNAARPPIPRRISPERPLGESYPSDPDRDRDESSSPTTTTTTQRAVTTLSPYFLWGRSVEVDCTLKILDGVNWTRELEDHDSNDFKSLANSVQRELNAVYRRGEFGGRFKGIQIEGFSRGSVFVDYTLYLTESEDPLVETELWTSFIDALENYTVMGPFFIDPDYLSFTVVRKITPPPYENEEDGFLLPHWAIAVIVIGAASLLFVLIICIVMTKNRRGGKRKYGTPLKEDSVAERGKNWDRSTYDNLGADSIYNINGTWDSKKLKQVQHARNYNLYGMAASITPASDTSLYGVTGQDSRTGSGSTKGETSSGGGGGGNGGNGRYYDSWRSDWSNRIPKQSDYDTTF